MSKFQPYLAVYIIVRQQQRILLLQRKIRDLTMANGLYPQGM